MTPQARAGHVRAVRARLGRASEPRFEVVHWTRGPRAWGAPRLLDSDEKRIVGLSPLQHLHLQLGKVPSDRVPDARRLFR